MKIILLLSFVLIFTSNLDAKENPEAKFKDDYTVRKLENGLTVILYKKGKGSVFASMRYNFGAFKDPEGLEGLAHFTEHMAFKSPSHFKKNYFNETANMLGDKRTGMTSYNDTEYTYYDAPSAYLERLIWLESQRMGYLETAFTKENFQKEKKIILQELLKNRSNKRSNGLLEYSYVIGEKLQNITGTPESLEQFTIKDVTDFYNTYYRPNNAILMIAGDFEEDQAMQWIEKYFNNLSSFKHETPSRYSTKDQLTRPVYASGLLSERPRLKINYFIPRLESNDHSCSVMRKLSSIMPKLMEKKQFAKFKSIDFKYFCDLNFMRSYISFEIESKENEPLGNQADLFDEFKKAFSQVPKDTLSQLLKLSKIEEINYERKRKNKYFQKAYYLIDSYLRGDVNSYDDDFKTRINLTPQDILDTFDRYITNAKPLLYFSIPSDKSLAYNVDRNDVDQLEIKNKKISYPTIEKNTPSKFTEKSKQHLVIPDIPNETKINVRPQNVWRSSLKNEVLVTGVTEKQTPLTYVKLNLGNVFVDDTSKKREALGILASELIEEAVKESLGEKTFLEMNASISVDMGADQQTVIHTESTTQAFPQLIKNVMASLTNIEEFEKIFPQVKENVIKENSNFTMNTFVDSVYFDEKSKQSLLFAGIDGTNIYKAIEWQSVKEFIESTLSNKLAKISIVTDQEEQRVVESLNNISELSGAQKVKVELIPIKLTVDLRKGIYIFDEDSDTAYITIINNLPNDITSLEHQVYNDLINILYDQYLSDYLREESGLSYNPYSKIYVAPLFTQLWTEARTEPKYLQQVIMQVKALQSELASGEGVTQEAFNKAKVFLSARINKKHDDYKSLLDEIDAPYGTESSVHYVTKSLQEIDKMTLDSVNSWAKKQINPEEIIISIDGNMDNVYPYARKIGEKLNLSVYDAYDNDSPINPVFQKLRSLF